MLSLWEASYLGSVMFLSCPILQIWGPKDSIFEVRFGGFLQTWNGMSFPGPCSLHWHTNFLLLYMYGPLVTQSNLVTILFDKWCPERIIIYWKPCNHNIRTAVTNQFHETSFFQHICAFSSKFLDIDGFPFWLCLSTTVVKNVSQCCFESSPKYSCQQGTLLCLWSFSSRWRHSMVVVCPHPQPLSLLCWRRYVSPSMLFQNKTTYLATRLMTQPFHRPKWGEGLRMVGKSSITRVSDSVCSSSKSQTWRLPWNS
jgi:hypothetical protein